MHLQQLLAVTSNYIKLVIWFMLLQLLSIKWLTYPHHWRKFNKKTLEGKIIYYFIRDYRFLCQKNDQTSRFLFSFCRSFQKFFSKCLPFSKKWHTALIFFVFLFSRISLRFSSYSVSAYKIYILSGIFLNFSHFHASSEATTVWLKWVENRPSGFCS